MSPTNRSGINGWIDIHGHFSLPATPDQAEATLKAYRNSHFLLAKPYIWSAESTLAYLDKAGIALQFLSNLSVRSIAQLRESNDYGASLARQYPHRFAFLATLPTDDAQAAAAEIERASTELHADGFAMTCCYNGVYLSDPRLDAMWEELNRRGASVFIHPNAYAAGALGRPAPLVEVAFETCRTLVSMLYSGHLQKYPHVKLIVAHCGGVLPALASRLDLLGAEDWVPNPHGLTAESIREQLGKLYLDTAATCPSGLDPALRMTSPAHIVYGADCGVPCSTERTMEQNRLALLNYEGMSKEEIDAVGRNVLDLFPKTKARLTEEMGGLVAKLVRDVSP